MTQQPHILSFDDARKSGSRSASASASASPRTSARSSASQSRKRAASARVAASQSSSRRSSSEARATSSARSTSVRHSEVSRHNEELRRSSRTSVSVNRSSAERNRTSSRPSSRTSSRRALSRDELRPRSGITTLEDLEAEERGEQPETKSTRKGKKTLSEKFSQAKRKHAKEKAGKAFTKQFGSESKSSGEAGPRAAVYKGEMGTSQRRATRMQDNRYDAASAGVRYTPRAMRGSHEAGTKQGIGGRIAGALFGSRLRVVVLSVAACLVLGCMFIYPAAKQYYQEIRSYDQIQAEYAAVQERNAALEEQRDFLESSDGIQQTARENYGWVSEGENAVLVYGLDGTTDIGDTNLSIPAGSVKAPDTWYSVFLDPLFGVE